MVFNTKTAKEIPYGIDDRQIKQITLEKLRMGARCIISQNELAHYRFSVDERNYGRELVLTIERDIASRITETKTVEISLSTRYPADCWEHFKWDFQNVIPNWFLERFPVKFTTETKNETKHFNVRECHPEIIMEHEKQVFCILEEVKR